MMGQAAAQVEMKQVLEGIKTVAIIDDVFDLPDIEHLNSGEVDDFFTALDVNDAAQDEVMQIDPDFLNNRNLAEGMLQKLWQYMQKNHETELTKLCEGKLFVNVIQDWNHVMCFCNYLESEFNLSLIKLGTPQNSGEQLPVELIFIDYYLGADIKPIPTKDSETESKIPAEERSIDYIKNIPDNDNHIRPFVVLMSSRTIVPEMVEKFREATGWVQGGMFCFIHKNDFDQKQQLSILLGALAKSLPLGYRIQQYIDVLSETLRSATEQFLSDVRTLSISDYAYIQKLSLLTEGHPLGDYMSMLYGSYLSFLIFENAKPMSDQDSAMNGLSFQGIPIVQIAPSQQLVKIYKSVLFNDNVGDITIHPLTKKDTVTEPSTNRAEEAVALPQKEAEAEASSNRAEEAVALPQKEAVAEAITDRAKEVVALPTFEPPYLQLGDLFVNKKSKDVLMIINAQCDLAFTPNGMRKIPADRSIILIKGLLQPLKDPIDPKNLNQLRTELFEYEKEIYRILWDTKQVVSYPIKDVLSQLSEAGYKITTRLRELYAIEIQNAFASGLTRVGMPVPPPVYQTLRVRIFTRGGNGDHKLLESFTEGMAYLARTPKGKDQCILTFELVKNVMNHLLALAKEVDAELESLDKNNKKKLGELNNTKDKIIKTMKSHQGWLQLFTPFELKNNNDHLYPNLSVKVCRGKPTEGKYNHTEVIVIDVADILDEKVNEAVKIE